ncbi:MAG: hypothetical protein ACRCYE_15220, partial [Sarcina sp.]
MLKIKNEIIEIKLLKAMFIFSLGLAIIVFVLNVLSLKSENFINVIMFNTTVMNIIIAAWGGSYILRDLVEDDSSEIIGFYVVKVSRVATRRLFKLLIFYGVVISILTLEITYLNHIYGDSMLRINMISLFLNFIIEGLVVLSLSYFTMAISKCFAISFSIVVSGSLAFYMLLENLLIGDKGILFESINFFIDDFNIYSEPKFLSFKLFVFIGILICATN